MASKILSKSAVKGLSRIGDILIPGEGEFPSFSGYMCMEHVDDLVHYAPNDDIKDLGMVLGILSLMPKSFLNWLVKIMAKSHLNHGPAGTLLRQLNLGIRGIVFSLYYSEKPGANYKGKHPNQLIGFTLNKVTAE
jgi:hypothetical protein